MERISSRQNPIVKRFRALAESSSDHVLLDGAHLLEEALAARLAIDVVALREDLADGPLSALGERAARSGARLVGVTAPVLAAISPVRQPSGVVAIARLPPSSLDDVFEAAPALVLLLADVQDPGNVGAVVRAAEACGATGVVTSKKTADPYGWKALRGSMGSAFRLPIAAGLDLEEAVRRARARNIAVLAAVPRDGIILPRCNLRRGSAILIGGEGAGLADALVALADERLTIPMHAPVESLNVATAAALIAYEARRQRTHQDRSSDDVTLRR